MDSKYRNAILLGTGQWNNWLPGPERKKHELFDGFNYFSNSIYYRFVRCQYMFWQNTQRAEGLVGSLQFEVTLKNTYFFYRLSAFHSIPFTNVNSVCLCVFRFLICLKCDSKQEIRVLVCMANFDDVHAKSEFFCPLKSLFPKPDKSTFGEN